jgi:hypothetical protein
MPAVSLCAATHGHLKRPGMLMWQPSLRKRAGTMDTMDILAWDSEQKHQESEAEGTSLTALDQDNMDLDK